VRLVSTFYFLPQGLPHWPPPEVPGNFLVFDLSQPALSPEGFSSFDASPFLPVQFSNGSTFLYRFENFNSQRSDPAPYNDSSFSFLFPLLFLQALRTFGEVPQFDELEITIELFEGSFPIGPSVSFPPADLYQEPFFQEKFGLEEFFSLRKEYTKFLAETSGPAGLIFPQGQNKKLPEKTNQQFWFFSFVRPHFCRPFRVSKHLFFLLEKLLPPPILRCSGRMGQGLLPKTRPSLLNFTFNAFPFSFLKITQSFFPP